MKKNILKSKSKFSFKLNKMNFLLIFVFLFDSFFLNSYNGIMSESKNIRYVKTKYFDIIFAEESAESARILSLEADKIYEELSEIYGKIPFKNFPVVITRQNEEFNAYWTSYPYNHIVIYDTVVPSSLFVFSETLLSVFRHELTHAFSFNMKNDFWRIFGNIFGDPANLGVALVSRGIAEGASVTSESFDGEGRIHGEYANHFVRQAKIEEKFPSFYDMQGAREKYPAGSFYNFNAAFADYLQKKYGMEKYADFWFTCVNFKKLTLSAAFKKVYGIKIKVAWNDFKNDFFVPDLNSNEKEFIKDFPSGLGKNNYLSDSESGIPFSLSSSADGKIIVWADSFDDSIYVSNQNEESKDFGTVKRVFQQKNLDSVKISSDGKNLAVFYKVQQENVYKKKLKIWNLEKKRYVGKSVESVSDGTFFNFEEKTFFAANSFKGSSNQIQIFELSENGLKNVKKSQNFIRETSFFCFTKGFQDGTFAFIKRFKMNYSICICDKNGNLIFETDFPKIVKEIQSLNTDFYSHEFIFSFASNNSMPSFGRFDGKNFSLYECNVSGGIFNPVAYKDKILFTKNFFENSKIQILEKNNSLFLETKKTFTTENLQFTEKENSKQNLFQNESDFSDKNKVFLDSSKKYNPFRYYTQGIFIPFSLMNSKTFFSDDYLMPFGITWISSNPWSSGFFQLSAGWSLATNSFAFEISDSNGSGKIEFDSEGFKYADLNLSLSKKIQAGKKSSFSFGASGFLGAGRRNKISSELETSFKNFTQIGYAKSSDDEIYSRISASVSASFSNVLKKGTGYHSYSGVKFQTIASYSKISKLLLNPGVIDEGFDVGFCGGFYFPKLLPFSDNMNFSYNFPSYLQFMIFCTEKNYLASTINLTLDSILPDLASVKFSTLIFGLDVEKAIPFLNVLYFNEINLKAFYIGGFNTPENNLLLDSSLGKIFNSKEYLKMILEGKIPYENYAGLTLEFALTPNFGQLTSSTFKTNMAISVAVKFEKQKVNPFLWLGLETVF